MLMVTVQLLLIELQGFLLSTFRGVGHVAFTRLLNTKDGSYGSTTDIHLTEETASFLVFKPVDGEYLLAVNIGESKDGLNLIESLTELALVKQHHNIRVVDDGFLHNGTADNILNFLCHHTDTGPELSGCLIQVLDIFSHHRGCYGLPCLFDDQNLTVFLDTHLLDEHIHDDKRHKREEKRVILDGVNFKDDESLIEEGRVEVFIQRLVMIAATVEVLHHITIGGNINACDAVLLADVWNTLHTELIERVEGQFLHLQLLALSLDLINHSLDTGFLRLLSLFGIGMTIAVIDKETLSEVIALWRCEALEAIEIHIVILTDDLLNKTLLGLGGITLCSFPDEHDKVLQESSLLHIQLLTLDTEGVHGDRMFLRIADILTAYILT